MACGGGSRVAVRYARDYCGPAIDLASGVDGPRVERSQGATWFEARYGLDGVARYLQISFIPPSLADPEVPRAPTFHAFRVESFNRSGDEPQPEWQSNLSQRPTVHATLGTVYNSRTELFRVILDALRDEPVNLIVTVGRNRDPAEFGLQPPNVRIERYIPHSLLLPYCDAVLHHGGPGSVLASLEAGLPMVLLPLAADQPQTAARCARAGVAEVLDPGTVTPSLLRTATHGVLQRPSYRQNAKRLQAEIMALPGLELAVTLLEQLASQKRPLISA
jgi:UDP:flavonoid glycosyltransferase YjiC (YdhE family)